MRYWQHIHAPELLLMSTAQLLLETTGCPSQGPLMWSWRAEVIFRGSVMIRRSNVRRRWVREPVPTPELKYWCKLRETGLRGCDVEAMLWWLKASSHELDHAIHIPDKCFIVPTVAVTRELGRQHFGHDFLRQCVRLGHAVENRLTCRHKALVNF